ncbi:COL-77 protein [Aphelenchoides avenae]|nr:COL-77 protein [Aphelenchus avenae]
MYIKFATVCSPNSASFKQKWEPDMVKEAERLRIVAFLSVALSTASLLTAVFLVPFLYTCAHYVQTTADEEIQYCRHRIDGLKEEHFMLKLVTIESTTASFRREHRQAGYRSYYSNHRNQSTIPPVETRQARDKGKAEPVDYFVEESPTIVSNRRGQPFTSDGGNSFAYRSERQPKSSSTTAANDDDGGYALPSTTTARATIALRQGPALEDLQVRKGRSAKKAFLESLDKHTLLAHQETWDRLECQAIRVAEEKKAVPEAMESSEKWRHRRDHLDRLAKMVLRVHQDRPVSQDHHTRDLQARRVMLVTTDATERLEHPGRRGRPGSVVQKAHAIIVLPLGHHLAIN